jgi:hypothetical protein
MLLDLDPDLHSKCGPDPDPRGQKLPTKLEKSTEISGFKMLDVLY